MKKILLLITIISIACSTQAQSFHVCNSNGTILEIPVKENKEITFDAAQRLINFHNSGNIRHSFATDHVKSIEMQQPTNGSRLSYDLEPQVNTYDIDEIIYNNIVETIITDETIDEAGDFIENYTPEKRVTITFNETGINITPATTSGITFETKNNTHLTVSSTTGKVQYIIKGKCSNGSIKFYSEKKFQLMLGGIELTNPTGPAINIQTGKTVYFTIGNATDNSLCDGATYSAPVTTNGEEEDQKGTIFSEGQLIFNGTGTLNVTALGGHAICSDDYIRIRSGKINILSALKDGFHTNDMFRVGTTAKSEPVINVNSTGDAIDCGKGEIIIEAGKLTLNSGGEAIKASYEEAVPDTLITPNVRINGGRIIITTSGVKSSAVKATGSYIQIDGFIQATVSGNGSKIINCDGEVLFNNGTLIGFAHGTQHAADTTSAGGIKCEGNMQIAGGILKIKCTGEGAKAINCNGDITIDGNDAAEVTLLSIAENDNTTEDDKKSRAISCAGFTQNGNTVQLYSYDKAISAASVTLTNGTLHAISTNDTKPINVDITQSGGWLMTKGE
ncbi:MAG: carbohydrate-binding domain-containing protein [Bacteroidaceae bacterium]|nr:carbohydrate-binding domain-containing protein [Bacteroidaceae bacterium]